MAHKSFAASGDVRKKAAFDSASIIADNDVDTFSTRVVVVELSLRARVAPVRDASKTPRAAAG